MLATNLEIPSERIAAFRLRWNIVELALFGSVLREDFRPDSDVDVLVTFAQDANCSIFDLMRIEEELSTPLGRKVDLVERRLVEQSENYIRRRQILSTAETIYVAREMPSTTHYDQKRRYPYRSVAILGFHNAVTIVIFAIGIVVGGCNKYGTEDLTANPSYGFGGAVGVWKSKTPLWVANVQGRMCLMATDQIAGASILETVPAGTEIRIEHLIMKRTFETDFIAPYGCLLSGPQAGKNLELDRRLFLPNPWAPHDLVDISKTPPASLPRKWEVSSDMLTK